MKYLFLALSLVTAPAFASKEEIQIDLTEKFKRAMDIKLYCVNALIKDGLKLKDADKSCDCYFINNYEKLEKKQLNETQKEQALANCIIQSMPGVQISYQE